MCGHKVTAELDLWSAEWLDQDFLKFSGPVCVPAFAKKLMYALGNGVNA